MACAPFFVAVMVGVFFKNEKSGMFFYIGFVVAMAGVILISMNGQKSLNLNPLGDGFAFLAMISWGAYSALVKKIGEWNYPMIAVTRRIYFYGIVFLIPVLIQQKASFDLNSMQKPEVIVNFLFLGIGAKCNRIFSVESGYQMDRSTENQCLYLCIAGCNCGAIRICAS